MFDNESKYFLDTNLSVYFCKNFELEIGLRFIDSKNINTSLKFEEYKGDFNKLLNMIEIDKNKVQKIISNIFIDKIGNISDLKDLDWIENYEYCFSKSPQLISLEEKFNYLVLKLNLLVNDEKLSYDLINNYFNLSNLTKNFNPSSEILNNINYFLSKKEYWILPDTNKHLEAEKEFVRDVLNDKLKKKNKFSFLDHKDRYLNLAMNSFITSNYNFNKEKSYFRKTGLTLVNQKKFLSDYYNSCVTRIINEVTPKELNLIDINFKEILAKQMFSVIEIVYEVLESQEKKIIVTS